MVFKRFSKRILFAILLCLIVLVGTVVAYVLVMFVIGGTGEEADFTFTWGSEEQGIVDGEFRLEITIEWEEEGNLTITIKANDDEYNFEDGVALVFDTNQNNYLDSKDEAYVLFADNTTNVRGNLADDGFIMIPGIIPELGPHRVTFKPKTGYTFIAEFPWVDQYGEEWNPVRALKRSQHWYLARNPLHIGFMDSDKVRGVFVHFLFSILEET